MEKEKEFDFDKYGAFFAFGEEQLLAGIKKHGGKRDDYVSVGAGLVAKKENWKQMSDDMDLHYESNKKKRLKKHGLEAIIKYELCNHEAYYTGDITDALEVLMEYGATTEQVVQVYKKEKHNHYED